MLVLGIETSCDETAASIVRDGREIVSSVISSQIELHKRFGGVVPELASSEDLAKIDPLVGVNYIEGHIYSVAFENPPVQYPALALVVSGGHTNIFHLPEPGKYKVVARTRDDAAGEAFDK